MTSQLAEAGYSPAEITHLAFSHYHYDHTANPNAFERAAWLVRRVELAAGHTPGDQVLYVKLQKTGGVVLSGDLYHLPEARRLQRVATFDFNQAQTPVTRAAIEAFLQKTRAQLWIQHDHAGYSRLKKAPDYYE